MKCPDDPVVCSSGAVGLDCFISAARTCCPATLTRTTTTSLVGLTIHTTITHRIRGLDEELCVLQNRFDENKVEVSAEAFGSTITNGDNKQYRERIIKDMREMYKDLDGKENRCAYPVSFLVSRFEDIKEGIIRFSSSDPGKCTGALYGQSDSM